MKDPLDLVLAELKEMRKERSEDSERLVRIETLITPLFPNNGQPGIITQLQDEIDHKADVSEVDDLAAKVDEVVTWKNRALGAIAVLGTTCTALIGKLMYATFGIHSPK